MDGFIETVENVFRMPVTMGAIKSGGNVSDITFACSLGLMRYGAKKIIAAKSGSCMKEPMNFVAKSIAKIKSIVSEYF